MHGALERLLIAEVGEDVGGRLRAGRSRNDQVATLFKMFLRDHAHAISALLVALVDALADQARGHLDVVMPGRTHLQHAQPVLLSHHLLAHAWPLLRDVERLRDWDRRVAADSPYGSGALAGSSLGLDPHAVARELGFDDSTRQLDRRHGVARLRGGAGVRGRPGRRRPQPAGGGDHPVVDQGVRVRDAARLVVDGVEHHAAEEEPRHRRAGAGQGRPADRQPDRAAGHARRRCRWPTTATSRRTRSRSSTPSTPSRCCCPAMTGLVATLTFDTARMAELAPQGFSLATDVAEWLVREGVPFRVAHEVAGACVRRCEELGVDLPDLSDEQYAEISPHLTPASFGAHGRGFGGLAPRSGRYRPVRVGEQLDEVRARLSPRCAARSTELLPVPQHPVDLGPAGRAHFRERGGLSRRFQAR